MLLEGALRFLDRAREGFNLGDDVEAIAMINNNIIRAQEIIRELDHCLNFDQGGELAAQLHRLYDYFDQRLQDSNLKKTPEGVDDVTRLLSEIRLAWATMLSERETVRFPSVTTAFADAA
jgi:flagellar protein FliS